MEKKLRMPIEELDAKIKPFLPFIYSCQRSFSHLLRTKSLEDTQANESRAFPYIPYSRLYEVLTIINKYPETTSFVDLGCGVPIIPYIVEVIFPEITPYGYELRSSVISASTEFSLSDYWIINDKKRNPGIPGVIVYNKDIFEIGKNMSKYDIIYYYNPIADTALMKKLHNTILANTIKGQIIIPVGCWDDNFRTKCEIHSSSDVMGIDYLIKR